MWIQRPEETRLDELLAGTARLVTVFGLGGCGASHLAERALARHHPVRVDLTGVTNARAADEALRGLLRTAGIVLVDQAHHPRAARASIAALVSAGRARIVVAARGPLGLDLEHLVALTPLSLADTRRLLASELARLGVTTVVDLDALARAVDGWPLGARAAALHVRAAGIDPDVSPVLSDSRCASILDQAWRSLPARSRTLLAGLSSLRAPLDATDTSASGDVDALAALQDGGLVRLDGGRVRVPAFVATFVGGRADRRRAVVAARTLVERLLVRAERAAAAHRRDPEGSTGVLERLWPELGALAVGDDANSAVRATLALEPLLVGRIERVAAQHLWTRALALAPTGARARRLTLGHVRTLIARGEHESAERVLLDAPTLARGDVPRAYRAIFLGHIEVWRGNHDHARAYLDEATHWLARVPATTRPGAVDEARQDLLVQRIFLALRDHHLDETERLARRAAALARRAPSPRLGALARRFVAEALVLRGAPDRAAPLFERTRDELRRFGDGAGALFASSRLVDALRAAGQHQRAEEEAHSTLTAAARAGEEMLELAVVDARASSPTRVAELAWKAQIPSVRARAERWLRGRPPAHAPTVLHMDRTARAASFAGRGASFARRATLWRLVVAIVEAHARGVPLSSDALFACGWPSDRVAAPSRRKRVQTAVWTLRRELFADALITADRGYLLDRDVRLSEVDSMGTKLSEP